MFDDVPQVLIGLRQVTTILRQNPAIEEGVAGSGLSPRHICKRCKHGKRLINEVVRELRAPDIERGGRGLEGDEGRPRGIVNGPVMTQARLAEGECLTTIMLHKQDARERELAAGSRRSRHVTVLGQSPFQPGSTVREVPPQVPEKVKIPGQRQERGDITRLALPC